MTLSPPTRPSPSFVGSEIELEMEAEKQEKVEKEAPLDI